MVSIVVFVFCLPSFFLLLSSAISRALSLGGVGSLSTLLWQHRVQLAELTSCIVHIVVFALVAQPVQTVLKILSSLFWRTMRDMNGWKLAKLLQCIVVMRRHTLAAHPVESSLNLTSTIIGILSSLLWQHRIQLTELANWIVCVIVFALDAPVSPPHHTLPTKRIV